MLLITQTNTQHSFQMYMKSGHEKLRTISAAEAVHVTLWRCDGLAWVEYLENKLIFAIDRLNIRSDFYNKLVSNWVD